VLGRKPATFALEPADSGGLARWVLPSVLAVVRRCCTSCARRAVAEHAELSQRRYLQTRPRVPSNWRWDMKRLRILVMGLSLAASTVPASRC
jgi:hypothetical protein